MSKKRPCPDCLGQRYWKAISPAGSEYKIWCPRCQCTNTLPRELSLDYSIHEPEPVLYTIGSVRVDTNDKEPISYMCQETGVGSVRVYRESELFHDLQDCILYGLNECKLMNQIPEMKKMIERSVTVSTRELIKLAKENPVSG